MRRGGIICFFYVNDIVFAFRKKDAGAVDETITKMGDHFKLNALGELKWFLGIHVFRDRERGLL